MLRKLALLILPLAVFAAACGGGSDNKSKPTSTTEAAATPTPAASTATEEPTSAPPTPIVIATADLGGASSVLSDINPLQILSGIQGGSASETVSPDLASGLLDEGDVPGGYSKLGEFSFNLTGTGQMAANMFVSGDVVSGTFGGMVMSAVVDVPPDKLGELDSLDNLSSADLDQIRSATSGLGIDFADLRVLDSSGLGDHAAGMHMVMDMSGMMNSFGGADGPNPFAGGLAVDMYMFAAGGQMHMVMVMWPADGSAGADARQLIDALYSKAGGNA
jgi:hypothetical protein